MIKGKRVILKKKYDNLKVKFDKNKDGLISLDEYLDDEISSGPKAKPTEINYHYQHYDNIYNYFMIEFLKKNNKFKILCAPSFILQYGKNYKYSIRAAIAYDNDTDIFYYNESVVKSIKECEKKKEIRFIFLGFIIIYSQKYATSHANMIVIDLVKKTFERFEPYGYDLRSEHKLDKKFRTNVKKFMELKNYKYISPINISPKIGVQKIADAYCGMCVTIGMMYLQLRILNPDISQKKIVKHLTSKDKVKLKEMILKFAKHVENKLKKNKNIILKIANS